MREIYNTNADFKSYVDSYCKKMKVSVEVALTHKIIEEVAKFYMGRS